MQKNIKVYVIFTYLMFILFIGLIGLVMWVLNLETLGGVLQTISAWTPTFVLLLMFKKIYPQDSLFQFIRRQFTEKIKMKTLLTAIGLPLIIFFATLVSACIIYNKPYSELMILSPLTLLFMLPQHLVSGPLGEELGWRAFLVTELQKKHTPLKSAIFTGLIWGFWHTPLWLVSGYAFPDLLNYIVSFMISIVCCSIIITFLYNESKNLTVAIIVHLLNNYLLGIFTFDLVQCLAIFAVFYLVVTSVLVIVKRKSDTKKILMKDGRIE